VSDNEAHPTLRRLVLPCRVFGECLLLLLVVAAAANWFRARAAADTGRPPVTTLPSAVPWVEWKVLPDEAPTGARLLRLEAAISSPAGPAAAAACISAIFKEYESLSAVVLSPPLSATEPPAVNPPLLTTCMPAGQTGSGHGSLATTSPTAQRSPAGPLHTSAPATTTRPAGNGFLILTVTAKLSSSLPPDCKLIAPGSYVWVSQTDAASSLGVPPANIYAGTASGGFTNTSNGACSG
jgi:hypothetical protein